MSERPLSEEDYHDAEKARHFAGAPYAFAYYRATRYLTPGYDELIKRLAATGCRTTEYLLRLALSELRLEEHPRRYSHDPECADRIQAVLDTFELGPGPNTVREDWFSSAKFWLSTCDVRGHAFLVAWVPTPRPGGNLAVVRTGPGGVHHGLCDHRVPEDRVPDESIEGCLLTRIMAHTALMLVRRGFDIWATEHPPIWQPYRWDRSPRIRRGPELDAAIHIEDAAVQMLCVTGTQRPDAEDQARHAKCEVSLSKLSELLSSDAYRSWRPTMDWRTGETSTLVRTNQRAELRKQLLSNPGPDYLAAACRHMAEWHRSRGEHAEAGLISAAARDLASNGESALLLHALIDHWIETDRPS